MQNRAAILRVARFGRLSTSPVFSHLHDPSVALPVMARGVPVRLLLAPRIVAPDATPIYVHMISAPEPRPYDAFQEMGVDAVVAPFPLPSQVEEVACTTIRQ